MRFVPSTWKLLQHDHWFYDCNEAPIVPSTIDLHHLAGGTRLAGTKVSALKQGVGVGGCGSVENSSVQRGLSSSRFRFAEKAS